jgi:hypothetical protein
MQQHLCGQHYVERMEHINRLREYWGAQPGPYVSQAETNLRWAQEQPYCVDCESERLKTYPPR